LALPKHDALSKKILIDGKTIINILKSLLFFIRFSQNRVFERQSCLSVSGLFGWPYGEKLPEPGFQYRINIVILSCYIIILCIIHIKNKWPMPKEGLPKPQPVK
jgi:hypothetical protein